MQTFAKLQNRLKQPTTLSVDNIIRSRAGKNPETGKVVPVNKDNNSLIPKLRHAFVDTSPARFIGENIHASDLIYSCVRRYAIAAKLKLDLLPQNIFTGTGLHFAIGNAIHTFVQTKLAAESPDTFYGLWACDCQQTHYQNTYSFVLKQNNCKICNKPPTNYKELPITLQDKYLVGTIDVAYMINGILSIHEIKSIKIEHFNDASLLPYPDHIRQACFYWWLAKEKGFSVFDKVTILYVNKQFSYKADSIYKEKSFSPTEYIEQGGISDLIRDLDEFNASREKKWKKLPTRRLCSTREDRLAKDCDMCSYCFDTEK